MEQDGLPTGVAIIAAAAVLAGYIGGCILVAGILIMWAISIAG